MNLNENGLRIISIITFLSLLIGGAQITQKEGKSPKNDPDNPRKVVMIVEPSVTKPAPSASQLQDAYEEAYNTWSEFLSRELKRNQTLQDVDRIMNGRHRDRGVMITGGTGNYIVYYLIDDLLQIGIGFDTSDRIKLPATIEPRKIWIKFPKHGDLKFLSK
ncbi:MAG: hypothetical protein MI923_17980 [Phycisphaerales bacterium]|nr:hypothetical protein [Phycisphaerales bacterium]